MAPNDIACLIVLVVDDGVDTRAVLKRMLELRGCCVVEAANGQEAVELAKRTCPDLILLDLNMPQLDGLAAAQQIRECKAACRDAPIVAMTAFDTYGMEAATREVGCDGYIAKPIDLDRLDRVLSHFLPG